MLTSLASPSPLSDIGEAVLEPKLLINSFPKSGTHLAALMAARLLAPFNERPWIGTFLQNSWSLDWTTKERFVKLVSNVPAGAYVKGHVGYQPDIEQYLLSNRFAVIFVCRDLRDVAVSQTYHIENENDERFQHPGKADYMKLPNHRERLKAVITGYNEWPGLHERWAMFEKWMPLPWVLQVRFEAMRRKPRWIADLFVRYVFQAAAMHDGFNITVNEDDIKAITDDIVAIMGETQYSPTFRRGEVGDWRHEFTPEIIDIFKEYCGADLIRQGYEDSNNW